MIRLTKTTNDDIWVDHRKIASMHVEKTPNGATYLTMTAGIHDLRVKQSPELIVKAIKGWDNVS